MSLLPLGSCGPDCSSYPLQCKPAATTNNITSLYTHLLICRSNHAANTDITTPRHTHLLICLSNIGLPDAAPTAAADGRLAAAPMLAADGCGACSAGVIDTHATPAAGALAADACTPPTISASSDSSR
jgi:hypothetical protein